MEADLSPLQSLIATKGEAKLQELLSYEESTEGWEDLGIDDEVESSRLYMPTGYYLIRGVGDIDQSPADIHALILDLDRKGAWDQLYVEGRVVANLTPVARVLYQHFSAPWPVSHRDFAFLSVSKHLEDGSIISVGFSVDSPLVPEVSGLVRGEMHMAGFILRQVAPKLTRMTYLVHIDPKGSIPTMVINQTQKKQTQNVSKIRNYLAQH
jgi:hypothetical protein